MEDKMTQDDLIAELKAEWLEKAIAPFIPQKKAEEFTNGLLARQTMANLSSAGKCPEKIYIRGQVCFRTGEFIDWVLSKIKVDHHISNNPKACNRKKR